MRIQKYSTDGMSLEFWGGDDIVVLVQIQDDSEPFNAMSIQLTPEDAINLAKDLTKLAQKIQDV